MNIETRISLLAFVVVIATLSSDAWCREPKKSANKPMERAETLDPIAVTVPAIGLYGDKYKESPDNAEEYKKELSDRLKIVISELEAQGIVKNRPIWLVVPMSSIKYSAIVTPDIRAPGLTKLLIKEITYTAKDYDNWKRRKYGDIYINATSDFGELTLTFSDWSQNKTSGIDLVINSFYSDNPANKWGKKAINAIKNGQIHIGMTKPQVMASIGRAFEINRTVGKWGVHEQWCYDGTYLYFENNKLKSWQD